ncbi:MAG: rRNA maturation RNase YbeY [Myxococcaceae bacterium]
MKGKGARQNRVLIFAAHPRAGAYRPRVRARARRFLKALEVSGAELSVALVGDAAIRRLNRVWRRIDRPTDVLSFPGGEPLPGAKGAHLLGDVIISLDTAARAAKEHGRTVGDELDRYLAHGLLHLLGHDHLRPADARRMALAEERLLGGEGMVPGARRPVGRAYGRGAGRPPAD